MNQNISFTPPHPDPLISVIIPCYNAAVFLPNCMKCLEEQTIGIEHLELIFVDDASSDQGATWDAILAFEAKYPNQVIAIQHEENKGQARARNTGLLYARGVYVGFMDQDDFIEPTFHQTMYEKAAAYDCDVVQCGYIEILSGQIIRTQAPRENFENYEKSIMNGGSTWPTIWGVTVWNKLFRRSLITPNSICFPDGLLCEDYYFIKMLEPYIKRLYSIEDALYHWQVHEASTSFSLSKEHTTDFITIGNALISYYQSLGIFERYYLQTEWQILLFYFHALSSRLINASFDYPLYRLLSDSVQKYFPFFLDHPAFTNPENATAKTLLSILNKHYTEEQFQVLVAELKEILTQMYT
ncbi:glycosyl transferase [Clostridia bacterium]|nr:glycosyl transferase [Clostridia bacterium]